MLKKLIIYQKNYLYDVAGGPLLLFLAIGLPLLLIVSVIAAVVVAVILIKKADEKRTALKKQGEKQQDYKQ